jgi:hypothetical protein
LAPDGLFLQVFLTLGEELHDRFLERAERSNWCWRLLPLLDVGVSVVDLLFFLDLLWVTRRKTSEHPTIDDAGKEITTIEFAATGASGPMLYQTTSRNEL